MTKIKQNELLTNLLNLRINFRNYIEVLKTFRENLSFVTAHGPEAAVEKHRSRGKLLAREALIYCSIRRRPFLSFLLSLLSINTKIVFPLPELLPELVW